MNLSLTQKSIFAAFLCLAAAPWVAGASAGTIKMEELEVEGDVHKPQVLFITDRSYELPAGDGKERLRTNFLSDVVADGRRIAGERNLPPTVIETDDQ